MESRESPSAADARCALAAVADCNDRMAARVKAPWWYHVGLGSLSGWLCFSQTLSMVGRLVALAVFCAGVAALVASYIRRTGTWISGYRAGRTRWIAVGVAAVSALGVVMVGYVVSRSWIAALIGIAVAIIVSVAGWAWEAAYRRDRAESV
jgi:FtsH-binding integral membrane protein